MTGEQLLHAIFVEPRTVRCGDDVVVTFRARNYGTLPSPPGRVHFLLGAGLDALAPAEVRLDPVGPGGDAVAVLRARVAAAQADRTKITVEAVLETAEATYCTNVEHVVVRSSPVLNGEGSGTFVEANGDDMIRIRAVVTNEGDGPAQNVRITLPAPLGCEPIGGAFPATRDIPLLAPAQRTEVGFDAYVIAPEPEISAEEARVSHDGGEVALGVRRSLRPAPIVAIANAVVRIERRRARIVIEVENRGWSDAECVDLTLGLPSGVRFAGDDATIDGIPLGAKQRRRRDGDALAVAVRDGNLVRITVAAVAARATVLIDVAATWSPGCEDGFVAVALDTQRVEVPFAPVRVRALRAHPIGRLRRVAPGELVHLPVRIVNAGDVDERFAVAVNDDKIDAAEVSPRTLRAGTTTTVRVAMRVPADVLADSVLEPSVIVTGDDGERARATFVLRVRRLAPPVALDCSPSTMLEGHDEPDAVLVELGGPGRVLAGVPFTTELRVLLRRNVRTVVVRAGVADATYLSGSTLIDGHRLLDRREGPEAPVGSPLGDEGLVLRDVPRGTALTIRWDAVAEHGAVEILAKAEVVADDATMAPPAHLIAVAPRDAFAASSPVLPYHIEGYAVAVQDRGEAPPAEPAPLVGTPVESPVPTVLNQARFEPALRLDDERCAAARRLGDAFRGPGLAAHLFALRLFFPDTRVEDRTLRGGLERIDGALGEIFDRLYVKLRIPGFVVSSDDLDDAALRAAVIAVARDANGVQLDDLDLSALERAPYGAPIVFRALIRFLPVRCADIMLADALSRYVLLLDRALERYDGSPLELFDDALGRIDDNLLSEARDDVITLFLRRAAYAEAVC